MLACSTVLADNPRKARVNLEGNSGVKGVLELTQASVSDYMKIVGTISGLKPGEHEFHVHEKSITNKGDCDSAGPHFNCCT